MIQLLVFLGMALWGSAFGLWMPRATTNPKEYGFRIAHVYPHDPTAFTQGLEFRGGVPI